MGINVKNGNIIRAQTKRADTANPQSANGPKLILSFIKIIEIVEEKKR